MASNASNLEVFDHSNQARLGFRLSFRGAEIQWVTPPGNALAVERGESCLAIDKRIVLGCQRGLNEGMALLTAGAHRFDFRFVERGGSEFLRLRWLPPGAKQFTAFPQSALILPDTRN